MSRENPPETTPPALIRRGGVCHARPAVRSGPSSAPRCTDRSIEAVANHRSTMPKCGRHAEVTDRSADTARVILQITCSPAIPSRAQSPDARGVGQRARRCRHLRDRHRRSYEEKTLSRLMQTIRPVALGAAVVLALGVASAAPALAAPKPRLPITITGQPSNPSDSSAAGFTWSTVAGATYTCQLDSAAATSVHLPEVVLRTGRRDAHVRRPGQEERHLPARLRDCAVDGRQRPAGGADDRPGGQPDQPPRRPRISFTNSDVDRRVAPVRPRRCASRSPAPARGPSPGPLAEGPTPSPCSRRASPGPSAGRRR